MSVFVLDASTAVSWIAPSQASEAALGLLTDRTVSGFEVPYLFPAEVRNALLKLERRHLLDQATTEAGLATLGSLNLNVRAPPADLGLSRIMNLARVADLSFYDSQYLDLALSTRLTLATRDEKLMEAAKRRGVTVIDTRRPEDG